MTGEINRREALGLGAASGALAEMPDPGLVLVNAAAREGRGVSGGWRYSVDPYRDRRLALER